MITHIVTNVMHKMILLPVYSPAVEEEHMMEDTVNAMKGNMMLESMNAKTVTILGKTIK